MRGTWIPALALAGALAAGCGSSAPPTTAQVAAQIGATGLRPYPHGGLARDAASARWHGRSVVIAVFTDGAQRDAYVRFVSVFDGQPLKSGPGYVVYLNQLGG